MKTKSLLSSFTKKHVENEKKSVMFKCFGIGWLSKIKLLWKGKLLFLSLPLESTLIYPAIMKGLFRCSQVLRSQNFHECIEKASSECYNNRSLPHFPLSKLLVLQTFLSNLRLSHIKIFHRHFISFFCPLLEHVWCFIIRKKSHFRNKCEIFLTLFKKLFMSTSPAACSIFALTCMCAAFVV